MRLRDFVCRVAYWILGRTAFDDDRNEGFMKSEDELKKLIAAKKMQFARIEEARDHLLEICREPSMSMKIRGFGETLGDLQRSIDELRIELAKLRGE